MGVRTAVLLVGELGSHGAQSMLPWERAFVFPGLVVVLCSPGSAHFLVLSVGFLFHMPF